MKSSAHRRLVLPALVAATALLLAACGTRVDDAEVVAGAGGGPAELDASVLEQLQSSGAATGSGNAGTPLVADGAPSGGAPGAAGAATGPAAGAGAGSGGAAGTGPAAGGGATAAVPGTTGNAGATGTTPKKQAGKAGGNQQSAGGPSQAAENAGAAGGGEAAGCTSQGAPVALGQVGGFSGVTGPIAAAGRTALAVWAKDVNARGGLACHPVVLYVADDGADPARSAAAVQDLTQSKNVQAIVASFSALSMSGLISGVEKAGLPVVGGDLLGFEWNQHPNLYPQGPGLISLIRGAIQQTVDAGKTKLGLVYCVEASPCTNGAKVIEQETAKLGGELVYSSAVSLTQTDFTAQCQNAKSKGVRALGVALDGASTGRVARSCAALGYHPQFVTSALTLSQQQSEDPNIRKNTLSTANPNAPFIRNDTPGQKDYLAAMKRYAPGEIPSATSIAAWASGKLLEAAVDGLGADARKKALTTGAIVKGLGTIKDETLDGLSPPITFKPGQKAAPVIDCSYFMLLTTDGWSAKNSKPTCAGGKGGSGVQRTEHPAAVSPAVRPAAMRAPRRTGRRSAAARRT